MAEYIDREAVLHAILGEPTESHYPDWYADKIKTLPLADVAPVVHGRWKYIPQTINTYGQLRCSICNWWTLDLSVDRSYRYCPNCGAKMDGDDIDG